MRKAHAQGLQHHNVAGDPGVLLAGRIDRRMRVFGEQWLAPIIRGDGLGNRKKPGGSQAKECHTEGQQSRRSLDRPFLTTGRTEERQHQQQRDRQQCTCWNKPDEDSKRQCHANTTHADGIGPVSLFVAVVRR